MIAGCGYTVALGMNGIYIEIDMAVPLSPDEVLLKKHAILYHQSQKRQSNVSRK
jgi:hypothetical protein